MNDVKAVLWDIGRVLVSFENRLDVLCRIARKFSSDDTPDVSCFSDQLGLDLLWKLDTGQVSHEELWKITCEAAHIHTTDLLLYRFTALYAEHLKPLPEIIEIAHQVQKSYVIVAVSDGDFGSMYAIDMLETHYGVRFQKRFESWRQGVKKPVLYMDALNYLKSLYTIHTDEIICIDDIEEYIKFANQIKMQGIVFDGTKEHSDQLRWRLKEAGLELSMANE